MDEMDEILAEFLAESAEGLDAIDQGVVALERGDVDPEMLNGIFRAMHTIKGTCGFLELDALGGLTHAGETLLDRLRTMELAVTPERVDVLCALVDQIRLVLHELQGSGRENTTDHSALLRRIETVMSDDTEPAEGGSNDAVSVPFEADDGAEDGLAEMREAFIEESLQQLERVDGQLAALALDPTAIEPVEGLFRSIRTLRGSVGFLGFERIGAVTAALSTLLAAVRGSELSFTAQRMIAVTDAVQAIRGMVDAVALEGADGADDHASLCRLLTLLSSDETAPSAMSSTLRPAQPQEDAADEAPAVSPPAAETPTAGERGAIRVDPHRLDWLVNTVGELVLVRNQIEAMMDRSDVEPFKETVSHLSALTTELYESALNLRMQPVSVLTKKLPRVVRDLARSIGKQVRIEFDGIETELDRTVIEAVRDPLVHILRNAVDHGIELPDQRVRAGKAPEGRLRFRAFHQGGKVRVEITDDGRGIDLGRVKSKAIEQGLVTEGQARSMANEQAVRLVLAPGFSTAERITNLSGRGVGMDVVKRNIESIGGSVDLTSRPGKGTTVSMELPLTLAIVQAFIVQVGDERFALPAIHVREIVNVDPENPEHRLDSVAGTPVFHLRGVHLPLLDLRTTLELKQVESNGTLMADHRHIAVVQIHNRLLGFVVSRVIDIEEIVVKPMPAWLSHFSMYAGTTILGNGFPGLILDTMDLARRVELRLDVADALNAAIADDSEAEDGSESLLVVVIQGDRLAAIPMPQVERLVEAEPSSLIRKGEHLRLREAGELLPVADMTGRDPLSGDAPMSVVIAGLDGALVGIGVNDVLRVVSTVLDVQRDRDRPDPMVMGTCLVDGDPIDVVDVEAAARHFGLRVQEPAVRIVPGRLR